MPDPRQSDLEIGNSSPNFPIDPVGFIGLAWILSNNHPDDAKWVNESPFQFPNRHFDSPIGQSTGSS
jgi:hypothetical protein